MNRSIPLISLIGAMLLALSGCSGGDESTDTSSDTQSYATGDAYNVTVLLDPEGRTCTVNNGSGTVGATDVSTITLTCTTNP